MRIFSKRLTLAFTSAAGSASLLLSGCNVNTDANDRIPDTSADVTDQVLPVGDTAAPPREIQILKSGTGGFTRIDDATLANSDEPQMPAIAYAVHDFMGDAEARERRLLKDRMNAIIFDNFASQFEKLREAPLLRLLRAVNASVNARVMYTADKEQYKQDDYVAAPVETLTSNKGDCEDYAMLKYHVLRAMGVPENRLYIALVNTEGKEDGLDHAVLVVNAADTGQKSRFVVLENGAGVELASDLKYSYYTLFNAKGCWQPKPEVIDVQEDTDSSPQDAQKKLARNTAEKSPRSFKIG